MFCGNYGALEPFTQNLGTCKLGSKTLAGDSRVLSPNSIGTPFPNRVGLYP